MTEIGYVKRGRGYGRVVILSRYALPKCEAVKWRWENEANGERHITESSKVIPTHYIGDNKIRLKKLRESIVLAVESEWMSLSNLGNKLNLRSAQGLWPICHVLEREGKVQMKTETWSRPHGNVIHFRTLVRKST